MHMLIKEFIRALTLKKLKKLSAVLVVVVVGLLWWLTGREKTPRATSAIACKNKITKIMFPNPSDEIAYLSNMDTNANVLEHDYFNAVQQFQKQCYDQEHIGPEGDGGWQTCMDRQFIIKSPCLVYSFGVGEDNFNYEKEVVRKLGCEVHAFDPSIGLESFQHSENIFFHNYGIDSEDSIVTGLQWKMRKLSTIMRDLNHQDRTIDLLKLDVEFSEWPALYDIIKSGVINNIRQIAMETHTPEMEIHRAPEHSCTYSTLESMQFMLKVFMELQQSGFQSYYSSTNYRTQYTSVLTGQQRYCCHNVHLVNSKHKENVWQPR